MTSTFDKRVDFTVDKTLRTKDTDDCQRETILDYPYSFDQDKDAEVIF